MAGDEDFVTPMEAARAEGMRVVVWHAEGAQVSQGLKRAADQVRTISRDRLSAFFSKVGESPPPKKKKPMLDAAAVKAAAEDFALDWASSAELVHVEQALQDQKIPHDQFVPCLNSIFRQIGVSWRKLSHIETQFAVEGFLQGLHKHAMDGEGVRT